MEIVKTPLEGALIIKPDIFTDERGYFLEAFNTEKFPGYGVPGTFLQDNESMSKKGVLRGLHFQTPPFEQGKLVRVVHGSAIDFAVDLRKKSPTYGQWTSVLLTGQNKWLFWIPPGFAHGFTALEDHTIFFYKCTNVYHKESEQTIMWNDPDLNIDWQVADPIISMKDRQAVNFRDYDSPF